MHNSSITSLHCPLSPALASPTWGLDTSHWSLTIDRSTDPAVLCVSSSGHSTGPQPDDAKDANITPEAWSYKAAFVKDIPYPPWCNETRWNYLNENLKYKDSDILVLTYPKCGTTWIEQVVLLLLHTQMPDIVLDPASKNTYRPGTNPIGKIWPEACIDSTPDEMSMRPEFTPLSWDEFMAAPYPRVIKSHAPLKLLLGTDGRGIEGLPASMKTIIVARNPLDACVSEYYHAWNPYKSGWPFNAWAYAWRTGSTIFGSYFDWHRDWALHVQPYLFEPDTNLEGKVLWLQYEDILSDPTSQILKLAKFLGVCDVNDNEPAWLPSVVEKSSFQSMVDQSGEAGRFHLRKGVVGDWRQHFSEALADSFINQFKEECAGSHLRFQIGEGQILTANEA